MSRVAVGLIVVILATGAMGCGSESRSGNGEIIDPTPEKLDGSSSQEFETADIERADEASEAVQEYCSDAVSEAQEVGCLSHVDESEIP